MSPRSSRRMTYPPGDRARAGTQPHAARATPTRPHRPDGRRRRGACLRTRAPLRSPSRARSSRCRRSSTPPTGPRHSPPSSTPRRAPRGRYRGSRNSSAPGSPRPPPKRRPARSSPASPDTSAAPPRCSPPPPASTSPAAKTVYFRERDQDTPDPPYYLEIVTLDAETPDPQKVREAIMAQKPGGIVLNYRGVTGWDYEEMTGEAATGRHRVQPAAGRPVRRLPPPRVQRPDTLASALTD